MFLLIEIASFLSTIQSNELMTLVGDTLDYNK